MSLWSHTYTHVHGCGGLCFNKTAGRQPFLRMLEATMAWCALCQCGQHSVQVVVLTIEKVCPESPERPKPDLLMGKQHPCLVVARRETHNIS